MISVVIPCSGKGFFYRAMNCLASIRKQTVPASQIIFVYMKRPDEQIDEAKFIRVPNYVDLYIGDYAGPFEPSRSRNIGLRRSKYRYTACVDADAILHPKTFEYALQEPIAINRSRSYMLKRGEKLSPEEIPEDATFASGPGCFIMAPTDVICDIRGWDERFIGYGIADWDYVKRLEFFGLEDRILPVANVHQWHNRKRMRDLESRKKNRVRYERNCENRTIRVNPVHWGKINVV